MAHRRATLWAVTDACVFDLIVAGEAPARRVLDEDDVVAFLDIRPVFAGHVLVVPRSHVESVLDLPATSLAAVWDAGRRIASAQRAALGAEGTFFGLNDIVSQSVPHVHLHVVPRRRKDGLRGFFWPRTRYRDDAEAEEMAASLRRALHPPSGPVGREPLEVEVRDARPGDAARLAELLAAGSLRSGENPSEPEPYRRALEEILGTRSGTVIVAETAGRVIGVLQLILFRHLQERGGLCAEIESVHVDAAWRSRGVGARLVEEAVDRARAAGCYRVQLTSNKRRLDAHRFYLRLGFEPSHEGFKRYL